MAFQAPQRQQAARTTSFQNNAASPIDVVIPSATERLAEQEQQEWILFSPAPRTQTTSTDRTRIADRSRLSDFGSLETAARSQPDAVLAHNDNETEDLDSLDDGLHAFNEPSSRTA